MIEQIQAELGNFIVSNLIALVLVLFASTRPKIARFFFSFFFFGAGIWNLFASLTMPAFYVATYGPVATPPYAAFINGPFAAMPALFVVPIAIGQLAIGILATGTGSWVRLSMLGSAIFLAAIAPMGVGAAFPFSLFGILAAFLLFRRPFTTTLYEDLGAILPVIGHPANPRGHSRRHG
ncbi:MAG TPA: hypothetical protein VFC51_15225 [Chloroflexota bacterium]|nr:hypothetical protein [Chloroflexota bacterium]